MKKIRMKEIRLVDRPFERMWELPRSGILLEDSSTTFISLSRRKILLTFPKGFDLGKLKTLINRSLEDLEKKAV